MSTPRKNPYVSRFGGIDLGRRGAKRNPKGPPPPLKIKLTSPKQKSSQQKPKASGAVKLAPQQFKGSYKLSKEPNRSECYGNTTPEMADAVRELAAKLQGKFNPRKMK